MVPFARSLFEMGPLYEIVRNGQCIGTKPGLASKDESYLEFEADADLREGDVLVEQITRDQFPIARVKKEVSGTNVILVRVFRSAERQSDRSRTSITQNIGTVHGGVAGRDFHGDVTLNMTVGDVLNYLRQEIERTTDPEEKKTLLARFGEFTKHPIIVGLATTGIASVAKAMTGQP
jgi:hypothetical protein